MAVKGLHAKWTALIKRFYPKRFTMEASHSPIHTHIHTSIVEATMQGANLHIGSNSGLSILLKDTSINQSINQVYSHISSSQKSMIFKSETITDNNDGCAKGVTPEKLIKAYERGPNQINEVEKMDKIEKE